jgi:hypothetical protein
VLAVQQGWRVPAKLNIRTGWAVRLKLLRERGELSLILHQFLLRLFKAGGQHLDLRRIWFGAVLTRVE